MNSSNPTSHFQAFLVFQFGNPPSADFSSAIFCVYRFPVMFGRTIVALEGEEHERGKISDVIASNNDCFNFQCLMNPVKRKHKLSGKNSK